MLETPLCWKNRKWPVKGAREPGRNDLPPWCSEDLRESSSFVRVKARFSPVGGMVRAASVRTQMLDGAAQWHW